MFGTTTSVFQAIIEFLCDRTKVTHGREKAEGWRKVEIWCRSGKSINGILEAAKDCRWTSANRHIEFIGSQGSLGAQAAD